ncbi:LysR family transcriptional regulator [Collimonas silvisoli]|uniref:LysR family transcriptional regulator n=1 Tax=Collimonas silvisoli TaxID=2825884 RepID=UPI001B8BC90C|nr:LysR family transcriptional regulator [Collimonas silvisoli]
MNTRFIETFVILAQLRSFRATARELHATPAAISLRVKALEEELKTDLIDRTSKEFKLTATGEYLLSYAKSVVDATKRMQIAANKESVIRGRLRLGVIESVVHSWLSYYINQLNTDYPELEIDLTVDMSSVLEKRLIAKELDIVIRVEGINSSEIVSDALAIYPVRWIAKKGLLSGRKTGLIQRVLERPILTFARGTAPQRVLEEIVANLANQAGIPATQTRITCSPSVAAIIKLVKDGYGIAAIPSLFVSDYLESGQFVELPMESILPSIVISMCRHYNAELMVHAAATAARSACVKYSAQFDKNTIEAL